VLWAAIRATQDRWPHATCVVYTGDHDADKESIIKRVRDRFNIPLNPHTLHFLYLSTRHYVLASTWPRFTLLGQSLGSLILALDAFNLLVPDIYIDTMGYAFTIALCKLLFPHVPTAAYVHYPTISTDMLDSLNPVVTSATSPPKEVPVEHSDVSTQGLHAGAGGGLRGNLKKKYWKLFAKAYSAAGGFVDVVMTNSSWTKNHIEELWGPGRRKRAGDSKLQKEILVVFPPVAVTDLESRIKVSLESEKTREPILLYIAQFRPEKNHAIILSAYAEMLRGKTRSSKISRPWDVDAKKTPKLVLVGSVRDDEDRKRVYKLRLHSNELQIKDSVTFVCDASWPEVLAWLGKSSIGVNGMWNEHFGIGVVEYQASGLIAVVNDSGGPKMDIVIPGTGFHASTVEEYADAFEKALLLDDSEKVEMRKKAQASARRFTEEVFGKEWVKSMEVLIRP
jgi:alpha-1,2-mannosyltransferase